MLINNLNYNNYLNQNLQHYLLQFSGNVIMLQYCLEIIESIATVVCNFTIMHDCFAHKELCNMIQVCISSDDHYIPMIRLHTIFAISHIKYTSNTCKYIKYTK